MPDDIASQWLRFELVTFAVPTGIPNGWDVELIRNGVPKSLFGRYRVASALSLKEHQAYGPLVRFGSTMRTGSICQDPRTGAILWLTNEAKDPIWLVNASLNQFIRSVETVILRFPFEGSPADTALESDDFDANWTQAVDDLTERLSHIDSEALQSANGFWQTFLDDIEIGDFSSKAILAITEK